MGNYREYTNRELRGPQAIVNKVRAERQYPENASLSFLLVEGDTDRRVYQVYVNVQVCKIVVAYNKDAAMRVLSILESEAFPGVLAIIDADFKALDKPDDLSSNLLFTDVHDLETMILMSPALEKVLGEFGSEGKIARFVEKNGKDIRSVLLESALPVGYLRWLSLQKNWSLKFEGLDFDKFIDKEQLNIDVAKLIRNALSRSYDASRSKSHMADNDIFRSIEEYCKQHVHDSWQVCCGHDLVAILSLGLRKAIGTSKVVEPELLESLLRLAYEGSYFRHSQLYAAIQQWENANPPYVVLLVEN